MKFRHLHIKNFMWLVPPWVGADRMAIARCLDARLNEPLGKHRFDINRRVPFATYILIEHGQISFSNQERDIAPDRITDQNGDSFADGNVIIGTTTTPFGAPYILNFTLNFIMRECPSNIGTHTVYIHQVATDVPLRYIGITRQPWWQRFNQHINAARTGSPYLFHDAIRQHGDKKWQTCLIDIGFDHDEAMIAEEARVTNLTSLYPLGLNMIPGGYAGLRYLHKLGITARTAEERDIALDRLIQQSDLNGRPNPLCAARWASDQDYINRVICGRAGRLTVEQVRMIRLHSGFGRSPQEIASAFDLINTGQVARAWSGKTYARVQ